MAESQSLNQISDTQKSWASRVSESGEQFELSQVHSRVDAVEKTSETCDSLSDADVSIDAVKAVFEAKAQPQNQVGDAQKSCDLNRINNTLPLSLFFKNHTRRYTNSPKGFLWKPAAGSQSPAASSGRGD